MKWTIIVVVMTPHVIHDPAQWNNALLRLPSSHVLQSWEWGAFKEKQGWDATRLLFYRGHTVCAAAQVLRRPIPHTPFGILYVPKGPSLDLADLDELDSTLAALEQFAREKRAVFIKIDPDVPTDGEGTAQQDVLVGRGWRQSDEQIQFKNTMLLNLFPNENELLAGMKPKTRYNIRLASKRGVRVAEGTVADLQQFYAIYAETSARDGFLIRQFGYYRNVWSEFLDRGRAKLFLGYAGNQLIAGLLLFVFGTRAWYFYGASASSHRELMPNYLLQWEAIRWAKAHGCTIYDFWGAPDKLEESSTMYGVYRFKEGFGGKFTQTIGAHDFVVNRLLYYLYAVARPRYLARLRKKHTVILE